MRHVSVNRAVVPHGAVHARLPGGMVKRSAAMSLGRKAHHRLLAAVTHGGAPEYRGLTMPLSDPYRDREGAAGMATNNIATVSAGAMNVTQAIRGPGRQRDALIACLSDLAAVPQLFLGGVASVDPTEVNLEAGVASRLSPAWVIGIANFVPETGTRQ